MGGGVRPRLLAAVLTAAIHPSPAPAEAGWTGYAQVTELRPTNLMRYIVQLDVEDNPSGCREKQLFYQDYTAPGSDKMYRLLLDALLYNRRVRVHVTGRCHLKGYAEISAAGIVP